MKQIFKSLIGTALLYVILTTLAVVLTMNQFLPVMAYTVPVVFMLQKSGISYFKDIYKNNPDNVLSKICSFVFNLLSIAGILYISITHTLKVSKEPMVGVMYGVVLYALLFPVGKFIISKLMEKPISSIVLDDDGEEKAPEIANRDLALNFIKGSLIILVLFGAAEAYKSIMNSLVKTRNNNNLGLVNDMIRNRFSLTNLPVKTNRA
jgi:hypothetical protein